MDDPLLLVLASLLTAGVGAIGGLGGAVLLVPALALTGMPAAQAAPLGLISVAAGSIAAGGPQLRERVVNHRLGVTTEVAATLGAVIGALASGLISDSALTKLLGAAALAAALGMMARGRGGAGSEPDGDSTIGEWPGQIGGAAPSKNDGAQRYRAEHVPAGLALMGASGLIAGVSGTSGGFLKTPVTATVMGVPAIVAAATTTFTVGVTAAAGLVVFAAQGRIEPRAAAAVIAGSLIGGQLGGRAQSRLPARLVRWALAGTLVVIATLLLVRS